MKRTSRAAVVALVRVLPVLCLLAAAWAVNAVEGRVNPARLGRPAIPVVADLSAPFHSRGQMVAVTGLAKADPIGDGMFLKPGPYLLVRREFERYGWMESPAGERVASGPEYSYRQDWSFNLHNSDGFQVKEGHENPEPHVEKTTYLPPTVTLGRYSFKTEPLATLGTLPSGHRLALTPELVDTSRLQGTLSGDYVYYQDAVPSAPKPGDARLSYYVLPLSNEMTVTGVLDGQEIKQGSGRFTLEEGGDLDQLVLATQAFNASQWRLRGLTALLLLLAYSFVIRRRLRGSVRAMAVPIAVVLTAGSSAAAMFTEGLQAFSLVVGPALLVGWWSLGSRRPRPAKPAAPLDEAEKKP